jgi:hypothetical protein
MDPYFEKRMQFANNLGFTKLFNFIDHWPLYAGIQNIGRFLFIYESLKSVVDIPGDIIELGSWKGANLVWLAKCQVAFGGDKKVHCFDSFEGLTEFSVNDEFSETGEHKELKNKYRGSFAELTQIIKLYDLNIEIHKGYIEDTVPKWTELNLSVSFVYFDADLYSPAKTTLDYLAPILTPGGVILFDEYGSESWKGETRAVDEFLENNSNFEIIIPTGCIQPSLMLKKISS